MRTIKCEKTFKDRFQHQQHTCPTTQRTLMRLALDENDIEIIDSDEKPFNCTHCDSKFPALDDLTSHKKSHTCQEYKKGQCKFGPRGSNSQGQCHFNHPRPCMYFETPAGCKKKDRCDFLHRSNSHPHASPVARGPNYGGQPNASFLDQGQMMMEILQQLKKLSQDHNNNGRFRGPKWPMYRQN